MSASRREAGRAAGRAPERRLLLLRHAKSDWSAEGQDDHERPLSRRGRHAAQRIGEELARRRIAPERILCSSARRTRETVELVQPYLPESAALVVDARLYLASPEALLERIADVDDRVRTLLVVGHNPGLEELATQLAAGGDEDALARLRRKFPTGGLADLRIAAARWRDVARARGTLAAFVCPRELDGAPG
jgi:phosphohistidine phosphatase